MSMCTKMLLILPDSAGCIVVRGGGRCPFDHLMWLVMGRVRAGGYHQHSWGNPTLLGEILKLNKSWLVA